MDRFQWGEDRTGTVVILDTVTEKKYTCKAVKLQILGE
jgi:hypothetical protein